MASLPLSVRRVRDGKGFFSVHQTVHSNEPEGIKCVR